MPDGSAEVFVWSKSFTVQQDTSAQIGRAGAQIICVVAEGTRVECFQAEWAALFESVKDSFACATCVISEFQIRAMVSSIDDILYSAIPSHRKPTAH